MFLPELGHHQAYLQNTLRKTQYTVEFGYNVLKGTEYFRSF
jgi:hypothetical protein